MACIKDCNCGIGNKRKKKGRIWVKSVIGMVWFLWCILGVQKLQVKADVWSNAYEYYNSYGNQAVFRAVTVNDGYIYCATRGVEASSGTKYRTIGWKIKIVGGNGATIQEVYVQLGGAYLSEVNSIQVGANIYNLYAMSLSSLKARLSNQAITAINQGSCQIVLDACMVVMTNGRYGGTMNDNGITSGNVYTTYGGIAGAANWTNASREALLSYFNKSVQGLFYTVSLSKGTGISWVSGAGRYCYGTYVTTSAGIGYGYEFAYWTGTATSYNSSYGFYVTKDIYLAAIASPKRTEVTFNRNINTSDNVTQKQTFTYGYSNQSFEETGFSRPGYHLIGWALSRTATRPDYSIYQGVNSDWVVVFSPAVTVYAVWEVNTYQIIFDGNGATSGQIPNVTATYEAWITMPQNQFTKSDVLCTFVGYGHSGQAIAEDYEQEQMLQMKAIANRAGVLYQNGATIRLYAIWDYAPVIHTADVFYSLIDANEGKITENCLAQMSYVTDREDGDISYGINANNYFVILNYDERTFLEMDGNGTVEILYGARDHVGNYVEKEMLVHVVDTTVTSGKNIFGKIRFIDEPYEARENSRWAKDENFKQLLRESLLKAKLP